MRTELLQLRVRPDEKRGFQEAVALAGIPLFAWVRERLRASLHAEHRLLLGFAVERQERRAAGKSPVVIVPIEVVRTAGTARDAGEPFGNLSR